MALDVERSLLADLALARGTVDRAAELRTDDARLGELWEQPQTRVLLVNGESAPMSGPEESPRLVFVASGAVEPGVERHFLGLEPDGSAVFAARPDGQPDTEGATWHHLRTVGDRLDDHDAGLLVTSVALDHWHDAHPHCARCGAPTEVATGGWVRRCTAEGSEHFPRTDPAVIMLMIDGGDRALLGRRANWPDAFYSTLAGFVEPGESAEMAVAREAFEEAGVRVGEVAYLGSQPWPFPCSLMLGYHAWLSDAVDADRITVDGEEIGHAQWFSRADLAAACRAGEVRLPPAVSIARKLIERWFGEPLPTDWGRRI